MIPSLLLLLSVLFLGSVVTTFFVYRKLPWAWPTAVLVSILSFVIWGWVRVFLFEAPFVSEFGSWLSWSLTTDVWFLTLLVLVLLCVVLVVMPTAERETQQPMIPLLLAGSAATMMGIWSQTAVAFINAYLLLLLLWGGVLAVAAPKRIWLRGALGWLLVPLFGLWWGVGTLVDAPLTAVSVGFWSQLGLLVAATVMMGVWPFDGWRPWPVRLSPETAVWLQLIPTIVGVALFGRVSEQFLPHAAYLLYVTLVGLLGMVLGVRWLWLHRRNGVQLAYGLTLVVMAQAMLVGSWAGREAFWLEARLLFAVVPFFVVERIKMRWSGVALMGAWAAIAALPLTVGLGGRLALYHVWWQNEAFFLILPMVALHFLTLSGLAPLLIRKRDEGSVIRPYRLALFLPLIGIWGLGTALTDIALIVWLLVWLPAVGAGLWLWRSRSTLLAWEAALMMPASRKREIQRYWRQVKVYGYKAVQEAIAILEGEGGLLWLLIVFVLFLLLRA